MGWLVHIHDSIRDDSGWRSGGAAEGREATAATSILFYRMNEMKTSEVGDQISCEQLVLEVVEADSPGFIVYLNFPYCW
jgi:hypothetical protein